MNLDQLHVFLVVARHLHFSQAAEELFITQPAVSAAISKLEAGFGVKLFHRIGRRVELTDAGRFLAEEGALLIDRVDQLERRLLEFNALRRGVLSLASSFTVGNYWLPSRLAAFRERYPSIELNCSLGNAELVQDGTRKGQFDLGFISGSLTPQRDERLTADQVGLERLVVVVAPGHRWYGTESLTLDRLAESPWILREKGSGAQQMFEGALARAQVRLHDLPIALVLNSSEMVKAVVLGGTGAAALPETMVNHEIHLQLLWPVAVIGLEMEQPILMVKHQQRQQSRLISAFEDLVKQF